MEKKKLVSREELKKFINENNLTTAEDVQDVLRDLFAEALQEMLEAEMDTNLGYEKNDSKNKTTPNRRNGHSRKSVRSEYGDIDLKIPRDREGDFEPLVV